MNKPVYLRLSILEISKILMYEFWYDYVKPNYQDNARLCYMDIDSFIIDIKIEDVYEDIADDVKKRFDTSNYEVNRPLSTVKSKKVIGLMKDEKQMINDKKAKKNKGVCNKKILKFNDYKDFLLNNEIILKSQQRFKSDAHNVYNEEINKIALSSNDDNNRIQTYDELHHIHIEEVLKKFAKQSCLVNIND